MLLNFAQRCHATELGRARKVGERNDGASSLKGVLVDDRYYGGYCFVSYFICNVHRTQLNVDSAYGNSLIWWRVTYSYGKACTDNKILLYTPSYVDFFLPFEHIFVQVSLLSLLTFL